MRTHGTNSRYGNISSANNQLTVHCHIAGIACGVLSLTASLYRSKSSFVPTRGHNPSKEREKWKVAHNVVTLIRRYIDIQRERERETSMDVLLPLFFNSLEL